MSFEELNEGQVVGVASMGKFLQEQGEAVPTQMPCGSVVFATCRYRLSGVFRCVQM